MMPSVGSSDHDSSRSSPQDALDTTVRASQPATEPVSDNTWQPEPGVPAAAGAKRDAWTRALELARQAEEAYRPASAWEPAW